MANQNPFGGNLGVTEGLEFFDKNFGFAGLTGASQSHSSLYVTRDGGTTFTELQLPLETVTELPPLAKELNFTIENYKYCEDAEKERGYPDYKAFNRRLGKSREFALSQRITERHGICWN